MNQTTNYNFNVPVGSDVVNPLVQDFPNWSSLDTILRNIANTGITTATHIKSGTIHTLSFSDTTVPMIRFQATADFNTNDTFTVNGLSVSALTVAGESLPAGAFVIGSMVLCELRDNLLTVYSSGSDASTLEGHPASYFATNSDLQTVDDKADANKVLIDQINNDLSDIKSAPIFLADSLVNSWNDITISGNKLMTDYRYVYLELQDSNSQCYDSYLVPLSIYVTKSSSNPYQFTKEGSVVGYACAGSTNTTIKLRSSDSGYRVRAWGIL